MAGRATSPAKRRAKRRSTLPFTWRDIALKVVVTEDTIAAGQTQLELHVVKPKGAPVPITSSGYYCHFVNSSVLAFNGGPIKHFTDWLDREARTKRWEREEFRWRQGDLFARLKR